MNYYDCKVRLQGNVQYEVAKSMISAPEVVILKRIHGADAVLGIRPSKYLPNHRFDSERNPDTGEWKHEEIPFDPLTERDRLHATYGEGLSALEDGGERSVNELFGGAHAPLMTELQGFSKKGGKTNKPEVGRKQTETNKAPEGAVI